MHTELAHRNDPDTSHIAAAALNKEEQSRMKAAILYLLSVRPEPVHILTDLYFELREYKDWPEGKRDSIAKRLSELVKAERVVDTGERVDGLYGRPVAVWAVAS